MPRRALFFDRDRTLIDDAPAGAASVAAHRPEHVRLLPQAIEALDLARAEGFALVVVTNQPGPAKGEYSRDDVAQTHAQLVTLLAGRGVRLDGLYVCLHHPTGAPGPRAAASRAAADATLVGPCACRKPRAGLIHQAAEELDLDLRGSGLVGDRTSDLEAARAAGVLGALVGPGRGVAVAVREVIDRLRRA